MLVCLSRYQILWRAVVVVQWLEHRLVIVRSWVWIPLLLKQLFHRTFCFNLFSESSLGKSVLKSSNIAISHSNLWIDFHNFSGTVLYKIRYGYGILRNLPRYFDSRLLIVNWFNLKASAVYVILACQAYHELAFVIYSQFRHLGRVFNGL